MPPIRNHRKSYELPREQVAGRQATVDDDAWSLDLSGRRRLDKTVRPESCDPEYLIEARMDAGPAWDNMVLADHECSHGKLPSDVNISCSCWGLAHDRLPLDLLGRVRGLSREDAIAALLAA